jgi:hypothetical protein
MKKKKKSGLTSGVKAFSITNLQGNPLQVASARVTCIQTFFMSFCEMKGQMWMLKHTAGLMCPPDMPPEAQTPSAVPVRKIRLKPHAQLDQASLSVPMAHPKLIER